jgi:hypothetical protein
MPRNGKDIGLENTRWESSLGIYNTYLSDMDTCTSISKSSNY